MGPVDGNPSRTGLGITGGWLMLAGCTVAILSVFAALLPVNLGVWARFEPSAMAYYVAAAIAGIGLLFAWRAGGEIVERAVTHPLVLIALFLFLWSTALAPLSEYPWLSLLGVPIVGEGALRFLAIAVLVAAALVIRREPRHLAVLLVTLLLASLGGTLGVFLWVRPEIASMDPMGISVVAAWVGAWFLVPERFVRWRYAVSIAAMAPIVAITSNNTVILVVLVGALPGVIAVDTVLRRSIVSVRQAQYFAILTVGLLPFLALVAVWIIPEFTDSLPSITSRKYMFQVLFAALQADPMIALWGQGWGEISLTADRFRTASEAILWDGSWDGFDRNVSHSSNILIEALFGSGVVAGLAILILLVAPVVGTDVKRLPPAIFAVVVFAGYSATWAQLAITVGMVAVALGICAGDVRVPVWERRTGRVVVWGLPAVVAVLLTAGSWLISDGVLYREQLQDVRARGAQSQHSCSLHPSSPIYADITLIQGFIKTYRPMFARVEEGVGMSEPDQWLVDAYLCTLDKRARESSSPALHLGMETFRSQMANDPVADRVPRKYREVLEDWPAKLAQMLNAAPNRKDMTVGFFVQTTKAGNWGTAESLARALIDSDPGDPVGHWFLGISLLAQGRPGSRIAAKRALEEALSLGIKRFLPVPPDIEAQIGDQTESRIDRSPGKSRHFAALSHILRDG